MTRTHPYLEPDGTQVFPINTATLPGCHSYPGATGEIRWDPTEGLTFCMELPHDPDQAAVPQMHGAEPRPQPGQFCEVPAEPAWTGTLADGNEFRLFLPKGTSNTIHTPTGGTNMSRTILRGRAAFAEVEIPKASCEPTAHRFFPSDSASFHFRRFSPTAHRRVLCRPIPLRAILP